ncbi:MAG: hypothetical protein KGM43_08420 [Planctomycetota bacterium]|nr:hypothetical protein [Planctomycetota bacterium]
MGRTIRATQSTRVVSEYYAHRRDGLQEGGRTTFTIVAWHLQGGPLAIRAAAPGLPRHEKLLFREVK